MATGWSVVQTVEAGRPVLSAVPNTWVVNNFLWWPNVKAAALKALLRNQFSKPDPNKSSWSRMECAVKRNYVETYEAANSLANEMSGVSSTSTSESGHHAPKKKKNSSEELSVANDAG